MSTKNVPYPVSDTQCVWGSETDIAALHALIIRRRSEGRAQPWQGRGPGGAAEAFREPGGAGGDTPPDGRMKTCTRCKKPHDGPHKACPVCLAKLRAKWPTSRKRTRRKALDKLGLCHECTNVAVPGTKHCAYHLERFLEIGETKRAKRKAEGRCYVCGRPAAEGRKACPVCLAKDRMKAAKKRLARRVVTTIAA